MLTGYHLSPEQKRLWLSQSDGPAGRVQCVLTINDGVEAERLHDAIKTVVARHEILRTSFPRLPGMTLPLQSVGDDGDFDYTELDLSTMSPTAQDGAIDELYQKESQRLLSFALLNLSNTKHLLLISVSSLCADLRSLQNMAHEITFAYNSNSFGEAPVQYSQFAEWHNEQLASETVPEVETDSPTILPLESDGSVHLDSSTATLNLPEETSRLAADLARTHGCSPRSVLLTAWQVLLWRLAGSSPVPVSVMFDGRQYEEMHEALGLYARWLTLSTKLNEGIAFIDAVRNVDEWLKTSSDSVVTATPSPFGFEYESWTTTSELLAIKDLDDWSTGFKLRLACFELNGRPHYKLYFDPAFYSRDTCDRIVTQYETLLRNALQSPRLHVDRIPLLSGSELNTVLLEPNETAGEYPDNACIHLLFEEQANKNPDAIAVSCGPESLTYAELNRRANQVGHFLREKGIGPESCVGLLAKRSIDTIVELLGILKAGAAYVPIDEALPLARQTLILEGVGASVVSLSNDWNSIANCSTDNLATTVTPDNLAYVMHTSGSMGAPKPVMISHRSVVNLWSALAKTIYPAPARVSLNAPLFFDSSVKQLIQLLSGSSIHIVPEDVRIDGPAMLDFLAHSKIDTLDCTPTQLRLLIAAGLLTRDDLALRVVLVGGEAIDSATWETIARAGEIAFFNVYGPTECTVDATYCRITGTRPIIGASLANTRAYILDQHLMPTPIGVPGELYIGGVGLSRGYLGHSSWTAERFIPDPFSNEPGARLYQSGDTARRLHDGQIEFLGRSDRQVKIRGHRVEPGEIESVLARHHSVKECVVITREDEPGEKRLVAYAVPSRKAAAKIDGRARFALPNGMAIVQQNRSETEYLYDEIFNKELYLRHGVALKENACVFDVGANIGMFSMFVGQQCPTARLYAFEPLAPLFETLRLNTELYSPQVKLFPFGLSDTERVESLTFYPHNTMMSGETRYADREDDQRVVETFLQHEARQGSSDALLWLDHADEVLPARFESEQQQCRLRRLSDVLHEEDIERIDLLKIDVQRAEEDVLRGIADDDWRKIDQVVMEVHDRHGNESEGRVERIRELLAARGFTAVAEQDESLSGTDRHNLYAFRSNGAAHVLRAQNGHHNGSTVLTADSLRSYLKENLPGYMVPSAFVLLDQLPLTRNGKVDHRRLPAPDQIGDTSRSTYIAPSTDTERVIAAAWRQALRLEQVGTEDNLFDLGGHSITLIQIRGLLQDTFARDIPLTEMFRHPTIKALADYVDGIVTRDVVDEGKERGQRRVAAIAASRNAARRGARVRS